MSKLTEIPGRTIAHIASYNESNPAIEAVKKEAYRHIPGYGLKNNWGKRAIDGSIEILVEHMGPEVLENPTLAAAGANVLADIYAANVVEVHFPGLEERKISEIADFYGLESEELETPYTSFCDITQDKLNA